MNVADSIHETRDGVVLDIEVVPGSSRDAFPDGYNEWRKRITARVSAPPEDGRANEALRGLVATFFGIQPSRVRITHGATSRQKSVLIEGVPPASVRDGLSSALK